MSFVEVLGKLIDKEVGSSPSIKESGSQGDKSLVIRVIAVGGGAGSALQHMISHGLGGVELIAVDSDLRSLERATAPKKLQIGPKQTNGLGTYRDPRIGYAAAEESKEELKQLVQGVDLVVIVAGMGGGTGSGASLIIADLAKEAGAVTVAVVTKPFSFEGVRHMFCANVCIPELSKQVSSLIVIDNNKLLKSLADLNISISNAFNATNDAIERLVRCIVDVVKPDGSDDANGHGSLALSELRDAFSGHDHAVVFGRCEASGANFIADAVQNAVFNALLEESDLQLQSGCLVIASVSRAFTGSQEQQLKDAINTYVDDASRASRVRCVVRHDDQLPTDACDIIVLAAGSPFRVVGERSALHDFLAMQRRC